MKPDGHLKLPGGSVVWWETAQEGRPPPLKCLTLPQLKCTHTHVHSYAQTPTPGLIHCSIIPFPLYQKEKEKETKEEGSEWRGWVGGEIACFHDFLPVHSRFCDPLSRTKSWNSLPSFLSKFKGNIESSSQNVKKDKLWRLGSHLVTGETQHCAGTNTMDCLWNVCNRRLKFLSCIFSFKQFKFFTI